MSSKDFFLARRWCHNSRVSKIGTTKFHFHGPEFDFPFLMQNLHTTVINGTIEVLTFPPLLMYDHFFCSVKLLILGRNLNEKDRQFTYFCIYSVMSLIGKTSVRHLTGAIAPQSLVPPLISSVGKIMIFKTFFPLLPSIFEADPGLSRL